MKATGIVRRVDMLGRVVIPKETRNTLRINYGDPIEIYTDKDEIILKKYSPIMNVDAFAESVTSGLEKITGHSALVCDKDVYAAATGSGAKAFIGKSISREVEKMLAGNKTVVVNANEGGVPIGLVDGEESAFINQLLMPITADYEVVGAIILADKDKQRLITEADVRMAALAAEFVSANV